MKMVDFDVAEVEYNMNKNKDIDIYSISYNELVEKLRRPQKYVLLEAFNEIYSLEIQSVTDTAFFLKLTDDAIKHYTRVEEKIVNENKELKKENDELKQQLADIDKLIYDLGHGEMQRQYEEITRENGEND